jgi:hypothetical protein
MPGPTQDRQTKPGHRHHPQRMLRPDPMLRVTKAGRTRLSLSPHSMKAAQKSNEAKTEKDARLLLEQRTNLILERLAPKEEKPKELEVPDINTDPAGHLAAVLAKTGMTVEQLLERQRNDDRQKDQNAQVGTLLSWAGAQEREFTGATPDYNDAGAFLQQSRDAELAEMGYTDPAQRNQIIQNEKLAIANKAKLDGKNPAAIVYGMAKLRGYAKKAPAEEVVDAKTRVENIDKGQKASESLTGTRGQGPSPLTATRLLEMSESEFAKYVDTPEGKAVMGG